MIPAKTTDPRLDDAVRAVGELLPGAPDVGVVLGSGLGGFVDRLEGLERVSFSSVPHLAVPTVAGHPGFLCAGRLETTRVLCLSGRSHLYEGRPSEDVVFGCRLLALSGCRAVLLTNAAGGIREGLAPGRLLLIADHLNLTGENPLIGAHSAFVDMTHVYDPELRAAARAAAEEAGVSLEEGVYAGVLGPSYETPAEVRMLRALGADAVGMSTVLEAIALRHLGVRVGAMSCITNMAAGITGAILDHHEVQAVAIRSQTAFQSVLAGWVVRAGSLTRP